MSENSQGSRRGAKKKEQALAERKKFRSRFRPKYKTAKAMEKQIQAYFEACDENNASYTVAGLAYHLGFARRDSLYDYESKPEFAEIINRAKLRIEMQRNEQLVQGQGVVAGQIFDLKCNFGWREPSQQLEVNNPDGNLGTKVTTVLPAAPLSIEEWQQWYDKMINTQKQEISEAEPIDVTPESDE